jgi:ABC-type molybdate transport system substrate-binding protein
MQIIGECRAFRLFSPMLTTRMKLRVLSALLATLAAACRPRGTDITVFHATSLTQSLGEIAERF